MAVTILAPKQRTPVQLRQAKVASWEYVRKAANLGPASWLSDKIALHRAIALCPFHVHKFEPKKYRYELYRKHMQYAIARCDYCMLTHPRCKLWIPELYHAEVGDWTVDHPIWGNSRLRKRGRWAKQYAG